MQLAPTVSRLPADEFGLIQAFLNPVSFDNDGDVTHDEGAAASCVE